MNADEYTEFRHESAGWLVALPLTMLSAFAILFYSLHRTDSWVGVGLSIFAVLQLGGCTWQAKRRQKYWKARITR